MALFLFLLVIAAVVLAVILAGGLDEPACGYAYSESLETDIWKCDY